MTKKLLVFIVIGLVLVVLVYNFMSSGNDGASEGSQTTGTEITEADENHVPEVRVQDLRAQPMEDKIEVTGRTQSSRKIDLRAETEGQLDSILVKKGELVHEGQVLAKLEIRDRAARVLEAEQLLNQRRIQYNASKELEAKGFNSRVRLAEMQSQLEAAKAQLKQAKDELANVNIKAPFDGVINGQMVEIGDYVSRGDALFDLVDLNPVEIVGYLTEKQIGHLQEGDTATAVLLEGQQVEGTVTFIAAAADAQTRTFEMEMSLPNPDYKIKEGLTAKIYIPVRETNAYKISPSILSLADDGTIGVKIVNAQDEVEFVPIKLLKDTTDHLWVGGLPPSVRIITVGQEFVIPGQKVKPVVAEGQSLL